MRLKIILPALACSLLLLAACHPVEEKAPVPPRENPFLIEPGTAPLVVAHRGGRNLAPENTLLAFDNAVSLGVDALEMDICLTKDEELVICHDVTIDRTSNGTGDIIDYTLEELKAFNFGYRFQAPDGTYPYLDVPVQIPTIEEVLSRYPDMKMVIEIKSSGAAGKKVAEKLMPLLKSYNMGEQVVVFSFLTDVTEVINRLAGNDVHTGASLGQSLNFLLSITENPDTILPVRYDMFALPADFPGLDAANLLEAAHHRRIGVHYWTVNDRERMTELILAGADGIITDNPDIMLEVLEELGF